MNALNPKNKTERDPKLVFIGIPALGEGTWDLARTLVSLELQSHPSGFRFVAYRCAEQGLAKARNILAFCARASGAYQAIFVDRDIPATPAHFVRLAESPAKMVGALYPKRKTPLEWVGEFLPCDEKTIGPGGLWPMESLGTGLLKVELAAFDELIEHNFADEYEHEDEDPKGYIPYGTKMNDFFGMGVRGDSWLTRKAGVRRTFDRYVTEDYMLSYNYRRLGGQCWTDPGCQVGHVGRIDFLDLEATIEKRCEAAVRRYKADLRGIGIKVPTLVRDAQGNVQGAVGEEGKE